MSDYVDDEGTRFRLTTRGQATADQLIAMAEAGAAQDEMVAWYRTQVSDPERDSKRLWQAIQVQCLLAGCRLAAGVDA